MISSQTNWCHFSRSTTSHISFFIMLALASQLAFGQIAEQSALQEKSGKEKSQTADIFELPDTFQSFKQLTDFIEEIDSLEPSGQSEAEMLSHQRKIARTVIAASEKFSSQKLSDEDAMQSIYFKLQGLRILEKLNEPKANELLAKAIEAALNDKRPEVQAIGAKFMVETGFAQWAAWNESERSKFIGSIANYFSKHSPEPRQVDMVITIVGMLGDMNAENHATQLVAKVMPHFQASGNAQVKQSLKFLQGVARRLNLPGNTMELKGTLLDGSKLDWESYRGKVVLVDYWATWCGPCRAEVPNLLEMYHAYHDKGFEVLGISLDQRKEQAQSYISQTKIPWPTMFSSNADERGWDHPMAVYYGVTGIPRAILVDREGKVVHMTARGEVLGRELRRLLGEPVARNRQLNDTLLQQASSSQTGN